MEKVNPMCFVGDFSSGLVASAMADSEARKYVDEVCRSFGWTTSMGMKLRDSLDASELARSLQIKGWIGTTAKSVERAIKLGTRDVCFTKTRHPKVRYAVVYLQGKSNSGAVSFTVRAFKINNAATLYLW